MKDRWWILLFAAAAVLHYAFDLDSDKIMIGLGIFYVFLFMAKFETQHYEISNLERRLSDAEAEVERLAHLLAKRP